MKARNDLAIGTIYRPPSADNEYYEKIMDEIQHMKDDSDEIIVVGDLNYDYNTNNKSNRHQILNIENVFDLKQLVRKPTRVNMNSSTLIDIILSSHENKHITSEVIEVSMSDHYCVSTDYKQSEQEKETKHNMIKYRDYKNFNKDMFLYDLGINRGITDLNFENFELEEKWDHFKNNFLEICDKHAPLKVRRLKDRCNPWISHDMVNSIYERDYKKKQAIKQKDQDLWTEYTMLRNQLTERVRLAKKKHYTEELNKCQGDPKKVWKFINKVTKGNSNVNPPNQMTAGKFNDYFSKIGEKVASYTMDSTNEILWKGPKSEKIFKFCRVKQSDVYKTIKKLGDDSNIDVLGFDAKLLAIACGVLTPILTKFLIISLNSANIPDDWKLARVTPVYKGKGDLYDEGNYRPISVIAHISKMFEHEVHKQLLHYMQVNNYINLDQSAYLKFHNTQTALHRVTDDWIENICSNLYTGICSLDIKKCFDTIDHNILLKKLSYYGIKNMALNWFQSYLTNRSQVVRCNGIQSDKEILNIGVPQGSILGPLLFVIFVNDISQHVHIGTASLYADDTLIYCDGTDANDVKGRLQECIDNVSNWYKRNKIVINASKSCSMLVTSKRRNQVREPQLLDINIGDADIQNVNTVSYLGIEIDNSLTWDDQVKKVCKVLNFKISKLSRLSKSLDNKTLLKIYNSMIQPSIDYALTVWGVTTGINLNKIQRMQNYAARIITKNFDYINVRGIELVKQLEWMNVRQRFTYFQNLLMFKSIHGLVPIYLQNNVTMDNQISQIRTRRHEMNLYVPFPENEFHKNILFHRGAKSWNDLPGCIKDCHEINRFKILLKNHIKQI